MEELDDIKKSMEGEFKTYAKGQKRKYFGPLVRTEVIHKGHKEIIVTVLAEKLNIPKIEEPES